MTSRTYYVTATPTAIRSFVVRAKSAREAVEIASQRAERSASSVRRLGWTLDFPGSEDEHWSVTSADGQFVMPDEWDGSDFDDEDDEA